MLYFFYRELGTNVIWLLLLGMCASRRTGGWEAVGCPPDKVRPTYEAANQSRVHQTQPPPHSQSTLIKT
jgi:hypothetical protein